VALLSAPVSRAPLQRGPAQGAGGSGRPMGRLHCDARGRVAPQNSLRAPRALRSDSCGEPVLDARCARRPRRCASRRSQRHPGQAHTAALNLWNAQCVVDIPSYPEKTVLALMAERHAKSSAGGGGLWRACGSPRSAGGEARARSALRQQIRGSCPSVANAVSEASEASSAAGPCARAPQGSRPCGPTDTPKRRSPPPSAECGTAHERRPATALANRNPSSTH
jgi:hypothetical protein